MEVIQRAKSLGIRRVIVSVSTGKDAAATLDLCVQHFDEVQAFFMYLVPDLSFQERYLAYHERRYGLKILRIPHWMLAAMFREGSFRHPTGKSRKVRNVKIRDIDAFVRKKTGLTWIASGERCADSLERNAQIKQAKGIHFQRHRFWPIGFWPTAAVYSYLRNRGIALAPEYGALPFSFGSLWFRELKPIQERFPEDFAKICRYFPLVPAQMKRYEERERREREQQEQAGQQEQSGERK
jgi:phosphoadenosine phosphosulfate reductase